MELNRTEVEVVQAAIAEAESKLRELADLQLALVGGGIGETAI
jgi:glutamyl-tRNA reductase